MTEYKLVTRHTFIHKSNSSLMQTLRVIGISSGQKSVDGSKKLSIEQIYQACYR